MVHKLITGLAAVLLLFTMVQAQEDGVPADSVLADSVVAEAVDVPAPPGNVRAYDTDNDHGHALTVEWDISPDDGAGQNSVINYSVLRSESAGGPFEEVGKVGSGSTSYENVGTKDPESLDYIPDHTDFYYRVDVLTIDSGVVGRSDVTGPVQSSGQWFHTGRIPVLVAVLVFFMLVLWFVRSARKGAQLYVRPLAGIEAVDEAIGRATEMGRPILYVLGLGSAADIATIASFTILGRVAKRVAEYQTKLLVPTYDPIVMSVGQEVVKTAYFDAGRPDDYDDDIVHFVTQSQFAYVAAVNGIMLRERPATNIYMGKFFAESLILAETGALAKSIQISGTDEIAQIPFFIVACDYTLIGEELYAASAYLGREPVLLGSLKAQDYAKAAVLVFAILGIIAANLDWTGFTDLFQVAD